jgi:hypothetical protein
LADALKSSDQSTDPELNQLTMECSRIARELLDALENAQMHEKSGTMGSNTERSTHRNLTNIGNTL